MPYKNQGGFVNRLLADPFLNVGLGLLSQSGPSLTPVNPWSGVQRGLLASAQAQAWNQKQQLEQQKMLEQQARQQAQMRFMSNLPPQQQDQFRMDPSAFMQAFYERQKPSELTATNRIMTGAELMNSGYAAHNSLVPGATYNVEFTGPNVTGIASIEAKSPYIPAIQAVQQIGNQQRPGFEKIEQVVNAANALRTATDMGGTVGDTATVYNFIKMLDPGSVVREGEVQLMDSARSLWAKLETIGRKATEGGMLGVGEKQKIRKLTADLLELYRKEYAALDKLALNKASHYKSQLQADADIRSMLGHTILTDDVFAQTISGLNTPISGAASGADSQNAKTPINSDADLGAAVRALGGQ